MSIDEEYDPLSSLQNVQKIIMLKNGTFEFDRYPNVKYLCGHSISEHLINLDGDVDCCLFVKDKELCICDRFQGEGSKIIMPKKIPKKVTEELLYK